MKEQNIAAMGMLRIHDPTDPTRHPFTKRVPLCEDTVNHHDPTRKEVQEWVDFIPKYKP